MSGAVTLKNMYNDSDTEVESPLKACTALAYVPSAFAIAVLAQWVRLNS